MSNTIDGSTVQIDGVRFREQGSDPSAPAASHWLLYAKATGIFVEDSAAVVTGPFGTGGGGGTDVPTLALTLTNDSAGTVNLGDVVYLTNSLASRFDIAANLAIVAHACNFPIGVVLDATIASGAAGKVAFGGYVPQINLDASSGLGNFVYAKASSVQASIGRYPSSGIWGPLQGAFGQTLDSGTTPPAFIWNPPVQGQEKLVARITGINMNSTGNFIAFTVMTGVSFIVTRVVARNASVSLTTASWSLGYNAASYDDVIANATHTELTGTGVFTVIPAKNGAALGAATNTLRFNLQTGEGSAATMDLEIYGFFLW